MTADGVVIAVEQPDKHDVRQLVAMLDELHVRLYPAESNHLVDIASLTGDDAVFLVARKDGTAIGCGAVVLRDGYGEIKRMFVATHARGLGLGGKLVGALEEASRTEGRGLLRLETGIHQPDAIRLYEKAGYARRGPFGDYTNDPLSVFMEKVVG